MNCLNLKNIDQLLLLQLLCFFCLQFAVSFANLILPYVIRFSFNLACYNFLQRTLFFLFRSLLLPLYNLHFSSLDNPLYSPLLRRPKMIKTMSQTSEQHSLLPYVNKFSWPVTSFFTKFFSKWAWLVPTHPYFKEFFVKTFSMMKYYKSPSLIKIAQKFR